MLNVIKQSTVVPVMPGTAQRALSPSQWLYTTLRCPLLAILKQPIRKVIIKLADTAGGTPEKLAFLIVNFVSSIFSAL